MHWNLNIYKGFCVFDAHQNFEARSFVLRLLLFLLTWVVGVKVDHLVLVILD